MKEKQIDWTKWHPLLSDSDTEIVRFCWPCEWLQPNNELEPRCRRPNCQGETRMGMLNRALEQEWCPFTRIDGTNGTMDHWLFIASSFPST